MQGMAQRAFEKIIDGMTFADVKRGLREVQKRLKTEQITADQFDMSKVCKKDRCGTQACIGGWLGLVLGNSRTNEYQANDIMSRAEELATEKNKPLHDLFYNYSSRNFYNHRSPAAGAKAITEWFKDPSDPWSHVTIR